MKPRADFVQTRVGVSHVPKLWVSDHDGEFRVGFLRDRLRREPEPARLPEPNADWRAPRKFERRR